jgi:hypothetical protein
MRPFRSSITIIWCGRADLKPSRYEPGVNRTYQDLADHYGFVVLPARIRRPRDKAKVEAAVGIVRWFAQGLAVEGKAVRGVHEAVEDGIGDSAARSRRTITSRSMTITTRCRSGFCAAGAQRPSGARGNRRRQSGTAYRFLRVGAGTCEKYLRAGGSLTSFGLVRGALIGFTGKR